MDVKGNHMIRLTPISTPPSKYLKVTARSNINSKKIQRNNSHTRFPSGGYHKFPFLQILYELQPSPSIDHFGYFP